MATRVTIQDIANELQLSRSTVSKAHQQHRRSGRRHPRKDPAQGGRDGLQAVRLPAPVPAGKAQRPRRMPPTNAPAEAEAQPGGKREIAMMTTCFLSNSHFSSMMLDRFQSEIHHLHYCMTIYRISLEELRQRRLPSAFDPRAHCRYHLLRGVRL